MTGNVFRILLILWCTVPSLTKAQLNHFEKLTENDGLSDNRITCFLKDRAGFMWIGTENGLNRYDGYTFRIYRPGQKKYALSHEFINDIEQDSKERLWIATWQGLNVLHPTRDSLYIFTPDEDDFQQRKSKIASSIVWDVCIDTHDRIWLALDTRDLCYYDPTTETFVYFPWKEFVDQQLPRFKTFYKSIQKVERKNDHELWLGTTLGLFSFDLQNQTFQYLGGDLQEDFVSLVYDSLTQQVYFGQEKIYRYDITQNHFLNIPVSNDLSACPKDNLLLSSQHGLWVIDQKGNHVKALSIENQYLFNLHHEFVTCSYRDGELLWVGTSTGVRLHDDHRDVFPFIQVFPDTLPSTSGNVYDIYDDEENHRFLVSSYTGDRFVEIDKLTGSKKVISTIQGKPLSACTRIYKDRKNRIWLLTATDIFLSDSQQLQFKLFQPPGKQVDKYLFSDMLEDELGNFWFASLRYGLFHYESQNNTWKLMKEKPEELFASRPTALQLDRHRHEIWIGDFSYGAFQYNLASKKFISHGMNTHLSGFLQSALVTDVALDKNNHVWIATASGGVSRYSHQTNQFVTYSMATGLPENTVNALEVDVNGNIWLATNKGLTCIKPTGERIRHFDSNSGLLHTHFTTPFSTNRKGELMIGLGNGFLKFHPDSLPLTSADFPIVITAAEQNNVPIKPGHTFQYHENEFLFQFSALTFSLPQQVTYYYRLEGYNDTWVNAGHEHAVRYANLGDGDYVFSVKAIDHTGKVSQNIATISFSIQPPFWKQSWFIVLIVLIAGSSLYLWFKSLQRKIHSQKILNQVATSLYEQNTIEDVFWMVAKNCITLLHFEDCVVYHVNEDRGVLIQKSAAGPKSLAAYQIRNPIEIKLGQGIVGTVAKTGKAEVISNTKRDKRYIVDDQARLSEIAVPIIIEGKVFGVIDSEHSKKNYYTQWHLRMLREIASICSAKIGRYFAEEQIRSKVARDLHDDMGSTLSSIKIMSNIALNKNDASMVQRYLKTIRHNANVMQESMSDMVWAINPENDTLEKVIFRMKEFAAQILEPLDIVYEFVESGDLNRARLDLNTRKDFFLIFKEALNNAAKYSQCKNVKVFLTSGNNRIVLRLTDDGIGFNPAALHEGNGLKNMRQRAGNIKATLQIESVSGEGTTIQLITPIT